ncbi:MAG: PLP-dependent transferase [Saprospiraceae bacterium]|nr:PLP-dependent transferase [Saprospiraceae bacterium]
MDITAILHELGEDREANKFAVVPPIFQTSNFTFSDLAHFRTALENEMASHIYTRGNNPTVEILRKKVAALEGAEDALIFSSGSAAIAAAVMANVQSGDHVICVQSPYNWTKILLTKYLSRFQVTATFVDGRDVENIKNVIQPNTKVLFLESPNSLVFELQDLSACAALAKQNNITTIIDNSYASPLYQQPIKMGIDIVVHSGTKYLNGHSDVVMGVVCAKQGMIQKIFEHEFMTIGAIISPHDASLAIRGLRTLQIRMERSNTTCQNIVEWLSKHPKIENIYYPHHPTHPQYVLAKKQMSGCGGLFSFYLKSDNLTDIENFVQRLQHFTMAVSWGGYESLILPTCVFYNIKGKQNPILPINFVRIYIGLEDETLLKNDLSQALAAI